jgi:hypothetical protein
MKSNVVIIYWKAANNHRSFREGSLSGRRLLLHSVPVHRSPIPEFPGDVPDDTGSVVLLKGVRRGPNLDHRSRDSEQAEAAVEQQETVRRLDLVDLGRLALDNLALLATSIPVPDGDPVSEAERTHTQVPLPGSSYVGRR